VHAPAAAASTALAHCTKTPCGALTSAAWLTTGAVVLSTGFARLGANANNTYSGYPPQGSNAPPAATGMTDDTHLRAACQATGPGTTLATQQLFDISILEFDIRPTISGPLVFRYVFGEGSMHGIAVNSCSAGHRARALGYRHRPLPGYIPLPVSNACSAQPDIPCRGLPMDRRQLQQHQMQCRRGSRQHILSSNACPLCCAGSEEYPKYAPGGSMFSAANPYNDIFGAPRTCCVLQTKVMCQAVLADRAACRMVLCRDQPCVCSCSMSSVT
jgi:hypothetical protein